MNSIHPKKFARAKTEAETFIAEDNYRLLDLGYSEKIVLPYKDGVRMLAAMKNAEVYKTSFGEPEDIIPILAAMFSIQLFSRADYLTVKMAGLLQVPTEDIRRAERESNDPTNTNS